MYVKPESFLTLLGFSRALDHSSDNLHNQNMCNYHPEKLANYCKIRQSNLRVSLNVECHNSQAHLLVKHIPARHLVPVHIKYTWDIVRYYIGPN